MAASTSLGVLLAPVLWSKTPAAGVGVMSSNFSLASRQTSYRCCPRRWVDLDHTGVLVLEELVQVEEYLRHLAVLGGWMQSLVAISSAAAWVRPSAASMGNFTMASGLLAATSAAGRHPRCWRCNRTVKESLVHKGNRTLSWCISSR